MYEMWKQIFTTPFTFLESEPIGTGGMGKVYLARMNLTGEIVAVKILKDLKNFDRFKHEADVLRTFSGHPHSVRYVGQDMNRPEPYIIMEYCEGGSLEDRIGRMTYEQIENVMLQLVVILKEYHRRNGVHRDIKPSNILFRGDGSVVLSDPGVARFPDAGGTRTNTPIGTKEYFGKEVRITGYETPSDIYALGMTFYEVLQGHRTIPVINLAIKSNLNYLLSRMTLDDSRMRPSIFEIESELRQIIALRQRPVANFVASLSPIGAILGVVGILAVGKLVAEE